MLTSIQCGADALNATRAEALAVSQSCLDAYRSALIKGKPLWVERDTCGGLVHTLLTTLQNRKRADFLDKRTIRKSRERRLKLDGVKALQVTDAQKKLVTTFLDRFAAAQPSPKFFRVLDIGRRIAGTGSLGRSRWLAYGTWRSGPLLRECKVLVPSAWTRAHRAGFGGGDVPTD